MTHRSAKRKYHPGAEYLEQKQLLTPPIQAVGLAEIVQVTSLVAIKPESRDIQPCGTGKGIRITTS
jgi:hypothetical protein